MLRDSNSSEAADQMGCLRGPFSWLHRLAEQAKVGQDNGRDELLLDHLVGEKGHQSAMRSKKHLPAEALGGNYWHIEEIRQQTVRGVVVRERLGAWIES